MEWCWIWQSHCYIDWTAWAAIGSCGAAVTAIGLALWSSKRDREQRDHEVRILLGQLFIEAQRILWVSQWCRQLMEDGARGAIPESFDPLYRRPLEDLASLKTIIFDAYSGMLFRAPAVVAGVLLRGYTNIKVELSRIETRLGDPSDGVELGRLLRSVSANVQNMENEAFVIVSDLNTYLGYNNPEHLDAGPHSYLDWIEDD